MTQVFISYARPDRDYASRLAHALERKGYKVWWDWDLIGGTNYRDKIRDQIKASEKVIVLWSPRSVISGFVIDEASEAKKHGKLVPLVVDDAELPFGFGDIHAISVRDVDSEIETIVAALNDLPPPRSAMPVTRRAFGKVAALTAASLLAVAGAGAAYWYRGGLKKPASKGTNRVALVIGNSAYASLSALPNAVRDAEKVAVALEQRGFRVIKAVDAGKADMTRLFTEFESGLAIYGGVGLFYYAGSAAYVDGEDILIPVDATVTKSAIEGGLNLSQLMKEVRSRTTAGLKDNGTAVVYSASKGQYAADGPAGGNSPFTSAFLAALTDEQELNDIFRSIKVTMEPEQEPAGPTIKQDPYLESNLSFKFYINHPDRDPAEGAGKILVFDSCRDNPFKIDVAKR